MGWAKLDDRRHENVKLRKAGLEADGLDVRGITYCAANETDGFLDEAVIPMLSGVIRWRKIVETLVKVGRWEHVEGGWKIHNYLEYNPSRIDIEAGREAARDRMQRLRSREQTANNGVRSSTPTRPDPLIKTPISPQSGEEASLNPRANGTNPRALGTSPRTRGRRSQKIASARSYGRNRFSIDDPDEVLKDIRSAFGDDQELVDVAFATWSKAQQASAEATG